MLFNGFSKTGKNIKFPYYLSCFLRTYFVPRFICRNQLEPTLRKAKDRSDYPYIQERVDYYCKLSNNTPLSAHAPRIGDLRMERKKGKWIVRKHTVYFFDSYEYLRYFDPSLKWNYVFGDVVTVPPEPAIVKSRPLVEDNVNSVLLNLDKVRHFIFLKDPLPFRAKKGFVVFRGGMHNPKRQRFCELFHNHAEIDAGTTATRKGPDEWCKPRKSIREHLNYKFVMSIEGIDVASNLKWIMSSNSAAVMPRPTCETWFMEGKLIPDYHYIEVKDDFSDLEEKLRHYAETPHLAESISRQANEYCAQFFDLEREKIISLLVLQKYLGYVQ